MGVEVVAQWGIEFDPDDGKIQMYRGDTAGVVLLITDDEGDPQDLTGITFTMTIKERFEDDDPLFQLTNGDGITILGSPLGYLLLMIEPEQTEDLFGQYIWDIRIEEGGMVQTGMCSTFTINKQVGG